MMFWLVLLLLGAVAVAFVVAPLLFRSVASDAEDRQAINLELYRERLADLKADSAAPEDEARQLELEAKRILLNDIAGEDGGSDQRATSSRVLLIAGILIPVLAVLIYSDFGLGRGAIADLSLSEQLRSLNPSDGEAYSEVIDLLAERAAKKPEDGELNFFLARSYSAMGEYEKAVLIFDRLLEHYPEDASLHSYYTEALFAADDRRLTPRVTAAIDATLALNPHDITMLEIRGMGAISEGDFPAALGWFQKALATGVTGRRAELIRNAVTRLHEELGLSAESSTPDQKPSGRVLKIAVSVPGKVGLPQSTTVFVYARAVSGPPAPLAVQRLSLSQLPATVTLDESMAMMPGMGLADFDRVTVIARLSLSGDVVPKSGDYEARSAEIDMNQAPDLVELAIEDMIH